ncbi:hypothetical protein FACS189491_06300 [Spirochaetia bacterium]|nr:hypothetical protein FACS189491_06300 [Spirochaetia bacterium]
MSRVEHFGILWYIKDMQESREYDTSLDFVKPLLDIKPLVSIIVPVFNAEVYLKDCLDSLIAQTLNEIEIICVNDGSTDRSLDILTDYSSKDPRIHVLNQKNAGPGMARNTALDNTNGKYILFCDSDDTVEPDAARELSEIAENTNSDIVIFNEKIINVDWSSPFLNKILSKGTSISNAVLSKKECLKYSTHANVWGYFFRTDLINKYHLRFTHHMLAEDSVFLISYLLILRSGYVTDRCFYNYYVRNGSLSMSFTTAPWINSLIRLPMIVCIPLKFGLMNKKPFALLDIIYWICMWLKKRI